MDSKRLKMDVRSSTGLGITVLHCGSEATFEDGCLFLLDKDICLDYHLDMTSNRFGDWFQNMLLTELCKLSFSTGKNIKYVKDRKKALSTTTKYIWN